MARRHHLAASAGSPTAVAGDLVGFHSSDPATVYLAARARITDFAIADLEMALYEDRTLLRMLGMRRTMFVVPVDLAIVMDAACTQALVGAQERRLANMLKEQEHTPDGLTWIATVENEVLAALTRRGPSTARELTEDVPELGLKFIVAPDKSYGGTIGVSTRVLFLLATRGQIVRGRPLGSWQSSQYRWDLTEAWLGHRLTFPEPFPARSELARRWLHSFGPGTETDLKWWTGWNLGDTRAALADLEVTEVELDRGIGYVLADDVDTVEAPEPWAAFLPSLDPTPMGWKEREWFLGDHAQVLYDRNGNIGPTIWVNGRVVGGWSQDAAGQVRYRIIEATTAEEASLIDGEAEQLQAWLGDAIVKPRFGTPLDKELRQA